MAVKTTVRAGMLRPIAKVSVANSTCACTSPTLHDPFHTQVDPTLMEAPSALRTHASPVVLEYGAYGSKSVHVHSNTETNSAHKK